MSLKMNKTDFELLIRTIPDFPKPGIMFRDFTPVLQDPAARAWVIAELLKPFLDREINAVAGIEARGFLFGMAMADHLQVPFIPIRKSGKLPFQCIRETYALEYGTAEIEIHLDAVRAGQRVLIHDDLLATGGTCSAAARLVERLGGQVAGFSFIMSLGFLKGRTLLESGWTVPVHNVIEYA